MKVAFDKYIHIYIYIYIYIYLNLKEFFFVKPKNKI